MFKTIIAATDGSEAAKKAVATAATLAASSGARLVLTYVIEEGRLAPELQHMAEVEHLVETDTQQDVAPEPLSRFKTDADNTRRVMEALAARVLAEARHRAAGPNLDAVDCVVEYGDPATRIIERAKTENADLIVTGSRGMSDLAGLLLGSVSHKIAHLAPCSCVTVR